jgi:hypothetical protein
MKRALALAFLFACRPSAVPGDPLDVPARIAVRDPRQPTPTYGSRSLRYLTAQRAVTDPPNAVELEVAPCAPQATDGPTVQQLGALTDLDVQESFDREFAALAHPPSVHCHIYYGDRQLHLALHGGQRTRAELANLDVALAFSLNAYDGSWFALEITRDEEQLLRFGEQISLANPPVSPRCGGPGFTGWLYGGADLRAFCAARAPKR